MERRHFLKSLLAAGLISHFPTSIASNNKTAKVVIVGGGPAGISVARTLLKIRPNTDITLVEKNPKYTTCFMSNEVIADLRSLESLQFGYNKLQSLGITVLQDEVTRLDADKKQLKTASGRNLPYDRCIIAPGIDFKDDTIDGYSSDIVEQIPHAWKAGKQTELLSQQIHTMEDGGTVIIAPPEMPYRCPAAPYERASLIAGYLKQHKPKSKLIILDPKSTFTKQAEITKAWKKFYAYGETDSILEWQGGLENKIIELDPETKTVVTEFGDELQADVLNLIPPQKAGKIAFSIGLADPATGWCPINKLTFESTLIPNVHVLGDACDARSLPKSAYAAASSAKVCASSIASLLDEKEPEIKAWYTNSCYAVIADGYAIGIFGGYHLSKDGKEILPESNRASYPQALLTDAHHQKEFKQAHTWFENFTNELFT